LAGLQSNEIALIADRRTFRGFLRYATLANKKILHVGTVDEFMAQDLGNRLQQLTVDGVRFMVVQTGRTRSRRVNTNAENYMKLASSLEDYGARLFYRDHYTDFWILRSL
jgi:hypothetical protein